MKHNLKICVSKEPKNGGVVAYRTVPIRERLLSLLFGPKQKVMVLVPGHSVEGRYWYRPPVLRQWVGTRFH